MSLACMHGLAAVPGHCPGHGVQGIFGEGGLLSQRTSSMSSAVVIIRLLISAMHTCLSCRSLVMRSLMPTVAHLIPPELTEQKAIKPRYWDYPKIRKPCVLKQ